MKRLLLLSAAFVMLAGSLLILGCENTFLGSEERNKPPEVWLSSGPVEGDTTGYQVHFYWGGWDPDGEVTSYEFVVAGGNPYGFNPEDTTGLDKWRKTAVHDSVFRVAADDSSRDVTLNNNLYTRYDRTHTFFLRAVDLGGKRSVAVYRSFTAWTLAPYVQIDRPPLPSSGTISTLSRVITFGWKGYDPIDSPDNVQDPDSIRYMYSLLTNPAGEYDPSFDYVGDLNAHPERYEGKWQPWIWYRAEGDSGTETILGDDEVLEINKSHVFAVQAKDEAGAVTGIFDRRTNFRQFIVSQQAGPLLTISEPFLGVFRFIGTNLRAVQVNLPPGVPLKFKFQADARSYGGEIVCFQYGWDVADVNNNDDWDSDCSPFNLGCTMTWYSGVHTLFVRVLDNAGTETLGQIEVNIVPFSMDRNLLWVDDFPSTNFVQITYATPREDEHDNFWLGICGRAIGFDPSRDVYDAYYNYNTRPPEISLIGRYKNIIWTYSSALDYGCWDNVIKFTPESLAGQGTQQTINYLSLFLAKGGHVLTEGNSERVGGLASSLMSAAQSFPMNLKCETVANATGCEGDTSGVNSYGYKDYCVTMLDKVVGTFRSDEDLPMRLVRNYDCMTHAYLSNDSMKDLYPGMPAELRLWDKVIENADRFFYPQAPSPYPGGFTLIEVYDSKYWMDRNFVTSQSCFHPLFRMKSKNSISCLNNNAIALWLTKYADIVPDAETGIEVSAPSFHLGFELWYFNRDQGNAIMNTIFRTWQISTP